MLRIVTGQLVDRAEPMFVVKLNMMLMPDLCYSSHVATNIYYMISVSMMLFGRMRHRCPD